MFEGLPYAVQSGDTFTIEPGCDESVGTCFKKFNNVPVSLEFAATIDLKNGVQASSAKSRQ